MPDLSATDTFVRRHVGPPRARGGGHARGAGLREPRRADRRHRARRHPARRAAGRRPRPRRVRDARAAAVDGVHQRVQQGADRHGLPRLQRAGSRRAQRPGKPRLVHGVHPVPGRDRPGPPRGAARVPDHARRPHRPAAVQRIAARRGDRGCGSDGAVPPRREGQEAPLLRRCRQPPADDRRHPDPRGGPGHHGARRRSDVVRLVLRRAVRGAGRLSRHRGAARPARSHRRADPRGRSAGDPLGRSARADDGQVRC